MKKALKKQVRAILNVNGKEKAFSKSGDTASDVIGMLRKDGIGLSMVVRFEEFNASNEKRRGRAARKY